MRQSDFADGIISAGVINIYNEANVAVDNAADFVLVSHGPNMHGGYLDKTNSLITISSPSASDEKNSDNSISFSVGTPSLNNDDIVIYKKREQISKIY